MIWDGIEPITNAGSGHADRATRMGKSLPVGARLTIQVTKAGMIGVRKTLTTSGRKAPAVRTLCVPPGASGPSAC